MNTYFLSTQKPDITVIIVNYNTSELVEKCLDSIIKHTNNVDYEIIVIDNASEDNSQVRLKGRKDIKLILNDKNVGFGPANNIALREAKGEYILFLNPDTYFCNNALQEFLARPEWEDSEIGAMGTNLKDDFGDYMHSYGFFPTFKEIVNKKKYEKKNINTPFEVEYITGAALMTRKSVLSEINYFDEDFFLYYEEIDLQFRMSRKGYKRIIIDTPQIVHHRGKSLSDNALRDKYRRRGEILYFQKHHLYSFILLILYRKYRLFRHYCIQKILSLNNKKIFNPKSKTIPPPQNYFLAEVISLYVQKTWISLYAEGIQKVYIFGAGAHTKWLLSTIKEIHPSPEIIAIIDEFTDEKMICSKTIIRPKDVVRQYDAIILSTDSHKDKFKSRCSELFKDQKLIYLYEEFSQPGPYKKI